MGNKKRLERGRGDHGPSYLGVEGKAGCDDDGGGRRGHDWVGGVSGRE